MMSPTVLNGYAEQLPRLTAEESLLGAERVAVGSGSLKKGHGRRISDGWRRRAGHHAPVMRPKTPEQYRAQMAGLGIGVQLTAKEPADG